MDSLNELLKLHFELLKMGDVVDMTFIRKVEECKSKRSLIQDSPEFMEHENYKQVWYNMQQAKISAITEYMKNGGDMSKFDVFHF